MVKVGERVGPLLVAAQTDTIIDASAQQRLSERAVFRRSTRTRRSIAPSWDSTCKPARARASATIAVRGVGVDGGRAQIDSAVVLGLLGFRPGDVYSETRSIDAQRHLYDLAVVSARRRQRRLRPGRTATASPTSSSTCAKIYFKQVDTDFGWGQLDCFKLNARLHR